jgi:hypothetical protein
MRLALLVLAAVAAVILRRRRPTGATHALVAWRDGAEVELRGGAPEHARMVAVAERALA